MQKWIEEISEYISDETPLSLLDVSEEMHKTTIETETLLQSVNELESAYISIIEKVSEQECKKSCY